MLSACYWLATGMLCSGYGFHQSGWNGAFWVLPYKFHFAKKGILLKSDSMPLANHTEPAPTSEDAGTLGWLFHG